MIDRRFPGIGEYGLLSDCETAALVAPDGSIEWLCPGSFDAPSVFTALLDREAGAFRVGPVDQRAPLARRYLPGTNILETTWSVDGSWGVATDALIFGPDEMDGAGLLLRTVRCEYGAFDFELRCEPRFGYGLRAASWREQDGIWIAAGDEDDPPLRLSVRHSPQIEGGRLSARARLEAGDQVWTALAWDPDAPLPTSFEAAEELIEDTATRWRDWLAEGRFPDHPFRPALQRSALALKGMIYAPRGSMVAAPTTSLPESPGGERNWDYRFTWVRDATFTLWGLHVLGFDEEAESFMRFIASVCDSTGPDPQIMFGLRGERDVPERELPHLGGYRGARPVRVGNGAFGQRQNDVYGALCDALYIHARVRGGLPDDLWAIMVRQAEGAASIWREPDQGIWESRGDPQHYCSSKLLCWVAFDRTAKLAAQRGETSIAERFRELADECGAELLERGVRDGIFRQHYETDALDASLLLVPLMRFLPSDDERVRATVLAIADELTENGLVLRYRVDETDDGLSGEEGTFTICSFQLVSALSQIGEDARARQLCEHLLSHAGALNLYAEELSAASGEHLGNFPQAFTHLALINAVSHVIEDETSAEIDAERGFRAIRDAG